MSEHRAAEIRDSLFALSVIVLRVRVTRDSHALIEVALPNQEKVQRSLSFGHPNKQKDV